MASTTINVGLWTGQCDLVTTILDNFDIILGLDFLSQAKAVPMPHLRGVLIQDKSNLA